MFFFCLLAEKAVKGLLKLDYGIVIAGVGVDGDERRVLDLEVGGHVVHDVDVRRSWSEVGVTCEEPEVRGGE